MEELNLKMIRYQDLLGELSREFRTISVSGTHGKTTTSLMISSILDRNLGTNYFVGDGRGHGDKKNKFFVLESCEYDKHFLEYSPETLIVTNIELEHTECYKDIDDIIMTFNKLANKTSKNLVLCGDDKNVLKLKTSKETYYYGFNENNDLIAKNLELTPDFSAYDVYFKGEFYGHFKLKLFGRHMILDSLAAIMTSILYNIPKDIVEDILSNFEGATRRFNETRIKDTIIVDDYAHHPTELRSVLMSARQKYPNKKIVGVFLPNTYSRTEAFMEDFAKVLSDFDSAFVLDIKCDRERQEDYPNVSSDTLIKKIPNAKKISIETVDMLLDYKDDVICFMSCANITPLIKEFEKVLNQK